MAAGLLVLSRPAFACSCTNGGPRIARQQSAAVFLGRVLSIAPSRTLPYGEVGVARLLVTRAIKGTAARDTVTLEYLVGTGGNCGIELKRGMRLLVYASAPQPPATELWTDYCAGTKGIECAAYDLQELGIPLPSWARDCRPSIIKRDRRAAAIGRTDPPSNETLKRASSQAVEAIVVERLASAIDDQHHHVGEPTARRLALR